MGILLSLGLIALILSIAWLDEFVEEDLDDVINAKDAAFLDISDEEPINYLYHDDNFKNNE